MLRAISRFAPPVALMALIFSLSATPDLGTGLGVWDTILRKAAHMAVFGALWLAWWRALRGGRRGAVAAMLTLAYAVSDELHQTTVAGRHGSPVDVLIDAAGVLLAALALRVLARRRTGSAAISRG